MAVGLPVFMTGGGGGARCCCQWELGMVLVLHRPYQLPARSKNGAQFRQPPQNIDLRNVFPHVGGPDHPLSGAAGTEYCCWDVCTQLEYSCGLTE